MELSVIIPTFQRHAKLAACLTSLAKQTLSHEQYEVLIGFDGPDSAGAKVARDAWRAAGGRDGGLIVHEMARCGYTAVRNRLLPHARGRIMVSTNDDVIAEGGFLEAHAREHAAARARGGRVVVSGASPWAIHEPDTLFHRLIRETSMIFFYDKMDTREGLADRAKDWGFRHAWGLNTSAPMDAVREVGGWTEYPAWYGYEDNEIAFKIKERFGSPVLYRPEARLTHDHLMSPREYLEREFRLGYAAPGVAITSPAFALATFGRDINAPAELAYSREFVARERTTAARLRTSFETLAEIPAAETHHHPQHPHHPGLVTMLYEHHLLLKRWMWRAGMIAWHEKRAMDEVAWPG